MNRFLHFFLIATFTFSAVQLFAQEKCTVLKPELVGTYSGKCKNGFASGKGIAIGTDRYEGQFRKGLADGEGKYSWSTGETYSGEWVAGQRHGTGTYTMHINGKDSVQSGLWQFDNYMGPKPKAPLVTYKTGIDRFNIKKTNSALSRVLIDIYQNGSRNKNLSNFSLIASSGQDISLGQSVGFNNVEFPVTIKISYTTYNKLNTIPTIVKFELEIYEPGDWTVELHN